MKKIIFLFCFFLLLSTHMNLWAQANSVQIVGGSYYNSITAAWAGLGVISSAKVIEVQSSYTGANETYPINLTAITGASATNTITIRPASGISSISITSSNATGTLKLNQSSYVIIDGEAGGTGGAENLIIENTTTTGYTIQFNNYANNNTIKYCMVKGETVTANNTPTNGVIYFGGGTSTGNSNNTINYCDIKDAGTGTTLPQVLIFAAMGSVNNSNNTISNCNLYDFFSAGYNSYGMYLSSYNSAWTISNNSFYQTAAMTATVGCTQYGIYLNTVTTGSFTVSGNYIGGSSAGCGGSAWNVGGSFANLFVGIYNNSGIITGYNNIQGNTIGNFNWTSTSIATVTPGIWSGMFLISGYANVGTITGNVIGSTSGTSSSITITSISTGSGGSFGMGISSSFYGTLSKNSISSITVGSAGSTYSANFSGIYSFSPITISKNFIHNIGITAVSSTSSTLAGIYLNLSSAANVQNNMISLGKDPAGNDVSLGATIYGIFEASTCLNSTYYFNSVYIGGTTSGFSTTYDFYTLSPNTNSNIKNNIFSNIRTGGGGSHYAIFIGLSTSGMTPGFTSNYNIFNAASGKLGYYGVTITNLDQWRQATFQDYNSGFGDPMFKVPNGTNATTDMHLQNTTPAEASGIDVGVIDDYDLQTRSGLTPVDIGADADNFTASDKFPPNIIYTPVSNTSSTSNYVLSNFATITDAIGVSTGANLPRIYYKKSGDANVFAGNTSSDNGWKYAVASNSSSPFSFTIDYSIINGGSGTVVAGTLIQYFVVAQDDANNLSCNPYGATYSTTPPVQNINGKAATPNSYYVCNTLSGTVTVGTSGATYTSLTKASGLFADINTKVLSGNLTVNIITDLTTEDGTFILNQWSEQGAGGYTLTINPSGGVTRTISGSVNTPIITLNGANRVTIDGLNSGGNALKIQNTFYNGSNYSSSTIKFVNGACSNTITNCIISGDGQGYNSGYNTGCPIVFSNASPTSGNTNNTISNCEISSYDTHLTNICIYSYGTSGYENYGNTIIGNKIHDFGTASCNPAGIYLDSYSANTSKPSWTIQNNRIYQKNTLLVNGRSWTGIFINTGGDGFTVNGNIIGYADSTQTNACTIGSSSTSTGFIGINITSGTGRATSVQNNTIGGINMITSGTFINYGINLSAGYYPNCTGNTVTNISFTYSSSLLAANILINNLTNNAGISGNTISGITFNASATTGSSECGIYNTGSSCTISNNNISSITVAAVSGGTSAYFFGIYNFAPGGTTTVSNNTIGSASANNIISDQSSGQLVGIRSSSTSTVNQQSNTVRNFTHSGGNTGTGVASSVIGIYLTASGTLGMNVSGNTIYNLSNTNGSAAVSVLGIYYSGPTLGTNNVNGNFINSLTTASSSTTVSVYGIYINAGATTYFNNIIGLGAGVSNDNIIGGIYENGALNNNNNVYFNTIYIGGTAPVSACANTYALYNNANTNTRNFRDNLLINARSNTSGTAKHYAVYLSGTTGLTIDYNDYYVSGTGGTLGYNSGDKTLLPIVIGQDAHSLNVDPQFVSPTDVNGTTPGDFQSTNNVLKGAGVTIASITTYYIGFTRPSPPSLGGIENGNPLPVELASFTSAISERSVTLNWTTAKEENNSGFEIQKQYQVLNSQYSEWVKVAFVKGSGTRNIVTNYSFTDLKLTTGKFNYRLKQIDYNGNFKYFKLNSVVEIGIPKKFSVSQNYPNPFNPTTKIDYELPFDSKVRILIYDVSGRELKTIVNDVKTAGYYTAEFNGVNLASGIYFYRMLANANGKDNIFTKKMVILK